MMKKRIPHFIKFGRTAVRHRSNADGGELLSRETSEKIIPFQEKDATNVKEGLSRTHIGSCTKSINRILSARSVFMVLPRQSVQHRTYHVSSSNRNKMYDGSVLIDESQGQNSSPSQSGCPFSHLFRTKHNNSNIQQEFVDSLQAEKEEKCDVSDLKNVPGPTPLPYVGTMHKYLPHIGKSLIAL